MSKEENNKAIVSRWFTDFWGETCNLGIVDELAAPNMLLQYSLHAPRKGHADIKAFMTDFRKAFPDLNFWGAADLIAEGDYVVGRWEGGGTHNGPAFSDFLVGSLPAATSNPPTPPPRRASPSSIKRWRTDSGPGGIRLASEFGRICRRRWARRKTRGIPWLASPGT